MSTLAKNLRQFVVGESAHTRLPERVLDSLRREQDQSEVLIGWCQLALVTTFAALYALAPMTLTEDAPFAPVPWALGLYFLFTVGRLATAGLPAAPSG